jgi:hypothetical protein
MNYSSLLSLEERRNAYLKNLTQRIVNGDFGVIADKEHSFHLFFGVRILEKTKTLSEIQNILKEKWYGLVTTIISVDRDEINQSIEISVIPQS